MPGTSEKPSGFEAGLSGAATAVAEFHEPYKTPLKRIQHWLHRTPSAVPIIVLLVAVVIFGLLNGNFFKASTLSVILQQIAIVGILGCAQSIVVLTAGIDLSVGAMAVFCSVSDGAVYLPVWNTGTCSDRHGPGRRHGDGRDQRLSGGANPVATLHRDARNLADHPGVELHLLGQRNDTFLRHFRKGAIAAHLGRGSGLCQ